MAKKGNIVVGKDPADVADPIIPPTPDIPPVPVTQTIDVADMQKWLEEKLGRWEGSIMAALPGNSKVGESLQKILDFITEKKPGTVDEIIDHIEDEIPVASLNRIPSCITIFGRPFANLFRGKQRGKEEADTKDD